MEPISQSSQAGVVLAHSGEEVKLLHSLEQTRKLVSLDLGLPGWQLYWLGSKFQYKDVRLGTWGANEAHIPMRCIKDVKASCMSLAMCPHFTFGVFQPRHILQLGWLASMDTSKCLCFWLLGFLSSHHFPLKEKKIWNRTKEIHICWVRMSCQELSWALPSPISFFLFFFKEGEEIVAQIQRMALIGILLELHYHSFMHDPLFFLFCIHLIFFVFPL